jgi:hypothetical protein
MLGSASAAQAGQQTPEDVVRAFFDLYPHIRYHGPAEQVDRPALKRLMSPSLMELLIATEEAENTRTRLNPGPPDISGDTWVSNTEGATSSQVQPCAIVGSRASCPVALRYDADPNHPAAWVDRYIVLRIKGRWLIDNIEWGQEYGEANLRGFLGTVIRIDTSPPFDH